MKSNFDKHVGFPESPEIGHYTSPKEIEIKSIPSIIVDPHNEVLPFWMKTLNEPALLIHIDNHADMSSGVRTFKNVERIFKRMMQISNLRDDERITNFNDYAKKWLRDNNFIAAAVYEKKVGAVYWYDPRPREEYVRTYGQAKKDGFDNPPLTAVDKYDIIHWVPDIPPPPKTGEDIFEPPYKDIPLSQAAIDIQGSNQPIILDIDLDAFLCRQDPLGQNPDILFQRLENTKNFIRSLGKKPTIISIARSQTPYIYTPTDKVDEIQNLTIKMLREIL